jgi:hypothetical protein
MDERYPIGVTASCTVSVVRHDGREDVYGSWSATIGLRSGEATIRVPGHYAGVLAERLGAAAERFEPGRRLARDEYLDVTALATDDVETLALSSTARSPVRVTIEVPRDEVDELASLPDEEVAARLVALRGLGEWTADWFLARHLARPHAWPAGDLGLRKAVTAFYGDVLDVRTFASHFHPFENLSAHYLLTGLRLLPPT